MKMKLFLCRSSKLKISFVFVVQLHGEIALFIHCLSKMSNAPQAQSNISGGLERLEIVMISTVVLVPCSVCLFVYGVMLFTLRSKPVFQETSRYILLFNLLFADTVVLAVSLLSYLLAVCRIRMTYPVCGVIVMLANMTTVISPLTLLVMSLERYVAVRYPLRHSSVVTIRNTAAAIFVVWAFSSLNVLTQVVLLIQFPFENLQNLHMKQYCGKENMFLDPVSAVYDKAYTYFLFISAGVVVVWSYIGVMIAARSASTDKESAHKARNTLLLHLVQLGLSLSSMIYNPILILLSTIVDYYVLIRVHYIFYIFVIIFPRCLSCLIYGIRDQNIRPILVYNLCYTVVLAVSQLLYLLAAFRIRISYPVCGVIVMLAAVTAVISPLTLLVMSLERYVAVCYPLRHSSIVTIRNTAAAIVVVWAFNSLNVLTQIVLIIQFPFDDLQNLQMKRYCSKENMYLDPLSALYDTVYTCFLFISAGVVVVWSYIGVMIAARSASTDKDSAHKARNTLLLHLVQLGLSLSSMIYNPILIILSKIVDQSVLIRIHNILYIFVIIFPRCLSCLIYSIRDQNIRPILTRLTFTNLARGAVYDLEEKLQRAISEVLGSSAQVRCENTVVLAVSQLLYLLAASKITLTYPVCGVLVLLADAAAVISPLTLVVMSLESCCGSRLVLRGCDDRVQIGFHR
ncbi:uncharacterized protein V6R79_023652 [Siganus canaliculatus]